MNDYIMSILCSTLNEYNEIYRNTNKYVYFCSSSVP